MCPSASKNSKKTDTMKAESGGYVNKTSFKVYISGAPAGLGTAAPGIGRRRQPKHEIPESGQCRVTGRRPKHETPDGSQCKVTGRQPKHEIPGSGLSRIAGRRAAPVIVRPDTAAAGSPDSRHCLRPKAGTSHCGRPEPGYRIRLQGPDGRHCRHPDAGRAISANSPHRPAAPGNRSHGTDEDRAEGVLG